MFLQNFSFMGDSPPEEDAPAVEQENLGKDIDEAILEIELSVIH